jgi:hypothetical protein
LLTDFIDPTENISSLESTREHVANIELLPSSMLWVAETTIACDKIFTLEY